MLYSASNSLATTCTESYRAVQDDMGRYLLGRVVEPELDGAVHGLPDQRRGEALHSAAVPATVQSGTWYSWTSPSSLTMRDRQCIIPRYRTPHPPCQ